MAKVKVVNRNLSSNLTGGNFTDTPSNTVFSFGSFNVTSNFEDRKVIDYSKTLTTFVRPVTLETMDLTIEQSELLYNISTNLVLNLDNSNLNTFVKFGSTYEFLRVSIENIILKYPASLYVNNKKNNTTYKNGNYDEELNQSTFSIPISSINNLFNLIISTDNNEVNGENILKNLNLSYNDYVITTTESNKQYKVIGFSGFSKTKLFITITVEGNPLNIINNNEDGSIEFHIKPNNLKFEEFRAKLKPYEKYILSERVEDDGFSFILKNPTLLDNGEIIYVNTSILWSTSDGYNIDIDNSLYRKFLEIVLSIGSKYDLIKTDLINRFLTPSSLKTYDLTENKKMIKLLRLYGWEFDQIRQFIDSLVYINKISYDKINSIPNQLIANMAKTLGWEYFSLVNEKELMESFLTIDENERNLNKDLLPAEVDLELWHRILNNTNYFWKSKGTRESIKSMFLLIGIPEPFINITEYVYTVGGKINPNTVPFSKRDFPTNSLPYDNFGYPKAPLETNDFYFQISGDLDSGQKYLDVFRMAGFNLKQTIDNKKSWIQTGSTIRIHNTTPQYYQKDNRLIINTKEVDVALDTARGIEYDVFTYVKDIDFPANNSRYALSYSYVNVVLNENANGIFDLPINYTYEGDIEVRYNGILLNPPKSGNTGSTGFTVNTYSDYFINNNNQLVINELTGSTSFDGVVQITFVHSGKTTNPINIVVDYVVTKINIDIEQFSNKKFIKLPTKSSGDVQLTVNGIALTKKGIGIEGDYTYDEESNKIYITNKDVYNYVLENKSDVQIAYINVNIGNLNSYITSTGETVNLKNETIKIHSFNTSKIYMNESANKCVLKLNYKIKDAKEIKILIDGVALEPYKDYDVNIMNPYEIFLPKFLRIGMVISVYYLVGGDELFTPIVSDSFDLGDISKLSFLEFLELIQRKLINVRTRKVVTNSKGGWYPTVQKIYEIYLKRAKLSQDNPFLSNGYTFRNLHPFLNKYNAFFQRFIDQILSATIILKKNGLLVRNSLFTRQKFTYKRGVNLYWGINNNNNYVDKRGYGFLKYFGDDGAMFKINQELETPSLYVETIKATNSEDDYYYDGENKNMVTQEPIGLNNL